MQAAEIRGKELLASVGLADKINRFPGQLSVGECQRAAVIRALINEPILLLADEPTGSLDHNSAQTLGELLREINIKFSIALVVVTHSAELSGLMKSQYQIDNGKLIKK